MKKRKLVFVNIFLALLVTITGLSIYNNSKVVEQHASWPKDYKDIESIKAEADLIARGKIVSTLPTYELQEGAGPALILTDSEFRIEKTYFDSNNNKNDTVIIAQEGGKYKGITYKSPEPVELLEEGQEYILFLDYVQDYDKYIIVGSFPGQFKIKGDSAENIGLHKNLKFSIKEIEAKINKP